VLSGRRTQVNATELIALRFKMMSRKSPELVP